MSHTLGPFRVDGPDPFGDYNILPPEDGTGALAAVVSNGRPPAEVAANACLFGAAPELVEALLPFAAFAQARQAKPLRGLDNTIHTIHGGTEYEASITVSDCERALAALAKARSE